MSQQSGIVVLIDVDAAVAAGHLHGNAYLIDNQKWLGSTGEGTGHLVTAVDGVRAHAQLDPQIMNWLAYGIAAFPPTLPKTFFARASHRLGHIARLLDITGHEVDANNRKSTSNVVCPTPQIVSITGEAVDSGVIFPAQYGSPDLFSEGLYWSASVNTDLVGIFAYTMQIMLYYPAKDGEDNIQGWATVIMPYEAQLNVANSYVRNGFAEIPALLPYP